MPPADTDTDTGTRRRRPSPGKLALGAVGLAVGTLLVVALREATLSTHGEEIEPDSRVDLVVDARNRNAESGQTLEEMVEAQLQACRLEVSSDLVEPIRSLGDGRYHAVLAPELDETNRRQFRGCVEDWMIDGVLVEVVSMEEVDEPDDLYEAEDDD